jgi:hypothetical protein
VQILGCLYPLGFCRHAIPEASMHTLKPYVSCTHMAIEISSEKPLVCWYTSNDVGLVLHNYDIAYIFALFVHHSVDFILRRLDLICDFCLIDFTPSCKLVVRMHLF